MIWRIGTLAIVAVVFGTLGTWLGDRRAPTDVHKVELLTPQVPPGGILRVRYSVFRSRICSTLVERAVYDSARTRFILEDIAFESIPGPLGYDEYTSAITIPGAMANGAARYNTVTTYRCNLVHRLWPIGGEVQSITFDVVGEPDPNSPLEVVPRR